MWQKFLLRRSLDTDNFSYLLYLFTRTLLMCIYWLIFVFFWIINSTRRQLNVFTLRRFTLYWLFCWIWCRQTFYFLVHTNDLCVWEREKRKESHYGITCSVLSVYCTNQLFLATCSLIKLDEYSYQMTFSW